MTKTTETATRTSDKQGGLSRRDFLLTSALVGGGGALAASQLVNPFQAESAEAAAARAYTISEPENILYTSCQNCNTGCGIKVKSIDGVIVKIDGNPFNPWTMTPHIDYDSSPLDPAIARLDGAICPRGQAGVQILYDPYRIRTVLKRAGKRGENKWTSIPFDQAVREVVEGGPLFANVPGEENRQVEGLRDIYALRDIELATAMSDDVKQIIAGKMTVAEFQAKHRDNLDVLIDPEHPDLGPKNNQLVFMWGRMKAGRSQMVQRFITNGFGSVNRHGHTTVCQGSLYFACKAMSEQYVDGKWTGGQKFYWQADAGHSEFIVFVGANIFEGGYGPPLRTSKVTDGLVEGRLKIAVVDPRLSKTAAKAWKWVPALPGSEGAMALGMIRWVIENERYDGRYLAAANKAAATEIGEPNWSNAAWLVRIDEQGNPGQFLRVRDLPENLQPADAEEGDDRFVVLRDGEPVALVADDTENPVHGDLLVDTTIGGQRVKSSLQLLADAANERTIPEWAEICGIDARDIVELAYEFTNYGKKAAIDIHRGVSQHTNGYYNVAAWMSLNLLIGNYDWKGGMVKPTAYDATGGRSGQPYPVMNMHPDRAVTFGYSIIRHEADYEKSTIFAGYPARRPWYPLASDIYQETIPSAGDAYPYPIKALILYMGAPTYALPSGDTTVAILSDTNKIPLFIANDITVGETSLFADYIFPDLSYMERWEFHGTHPSVSPKVQPVRNPVASPMVETVTVFGEETPICLESMLMAFAEQLEVSGYGPDGFGPGDKLNHMDDFYLKMVANVAAEDAPVADASDEEVELFVQSRRHLHSSVFDVDRWATAAGEEWWRKVVYVLNRGGRFQGYADAYNGVKLRNAYARQINLYHEKTAKARNSMTGDYFPGIAKYIPIADSMGQPLTDREQGYPLQLSTYRQSTQTKSRTNGCYWLLAINPENEVLINRVDAEVLGLQSGDIVRIRSASNPNGEWDLGELGRKPVEGRLKVVEGMRPGVITFSLGFGHWANGASDLEIDGQVIAGDPRRGRGIHANAVMRVDPHLGNTCLSDLAGGSAVFYDTWVKLDKVASAV